MKTIVWRILCLLHQVRAEIPALYLHSDGYFAVLDWSQPLRCLSFQLIGPLNWNAPGKIIADHAFMIKPRLLMISLYVAGSTDLASSVIAKILLHFFQSLTYDIICISHGLGDIHRRLFLIPILLLLWFTMVKCGIYLYSYKATRTMKTNYNNIWRVNLVPSSLRVAVPLPHTHTRTRTHTHEV